MTCSCCKPRVDAFPDEPTEHEAAVAIFRSTLIMHPNLALSTCGVIMYDEQGVMLGSTTLETLFEKIGAQA